MIKMIVSPNSSELILQIPQKYIGKELEVIALSKNDFTYSSSEEITLTHFASEAVLAKDWLSAEEDEAWKSL